MISLILYGRNDSHGYNLHKRAAISLNAMAEVLDGSDDEIIFVDYNTPDDLPTFPEAIQDTLTAVTKQRLRVLRVRPKHHRRFEAKTHLVAVEPIARNVALRRSNPCNRWVLSTNTDMIFVPTDPSGSLSDIAATLEDGYYHLPRFELPECLWEGFDRTDGIGIIAAAREFGPRFHLRDIVHSHHDNLYDAPGDFQLALRSDLFDIHGFHEDMLIGWHVDANIARRMKLKRGQVQSALEHLTGYHCDHTRQATAYHGHDRKENDSVRFVSNVISPLIPAQAESWGLVEENIEEIDLRRGVTVRYFETLRTRLPAGSDAFYESRYTPDSYNDLRYTPEHVIPYVLDLLSCAPPGQLLGYAGVRLDTYRLLRGALATLDPTIRMVTPTTCDWLPSRDQLAPQLWNDSVETVLFEIGEAQTGQDDKVGHIASLFQRFMDLEEDRFAEGDKPPRRVIAINAIHNDFDPIVAGRMSYTTTPFSSRTRHGYVLPTRVRRNKRPPRPNMLELGERIATRTGRSRLVSAEEIRYLTEVLNRIALHDDLSSPSWQEAFALGATLQVFAELAKAHHLTDQTTKDLGVIARILEENSWSERLADAVAPIECCDGPSTSGSRFANIEDWERPSFAKWAIRFFGGRSACDYHKRRPWVWDRVAILEMLDQEFGLSSGEASVPPRLLIIANQAEYLAACAVELGCETTFIDPACLTGQAASSADWRDDLHYVRPELRRRVIRLENEQELAAQTFDAAIFPQNSILWGGTGRASELLEQVRSSLKPDGLILAACQIRLGEGAESHALSRALAPTPALTRRLAQAAGAEAAFGSDARLSRQSLNSFASAAHLVGGLEPFVHHEEARTTSCLWAWRHKAALAFNAAELNALFTSPATQSEPRRIAVAAAASDFRAKVASSTERTVGAPVLVLAHSAPEPVVAAAPAAKAIQSPTRKSLISVLRAGPQAIKTPMGIRIATGVAAGLLADGELGFFGPGEYELIFEAVAQDPSAQTALTIHIQYGGVPLLVQSFSARALSEKQRQDIDLALPKPAHLKGPGPLRVTFDHHGEIGVSLNHLIVY